MERSRVLLLSLALSIACASTASADDDLWTVSFMNDSPYQVSIWVDGNFVCTMQPGSNCSTRVQSDATHQVHATNTDNQTYDDAFDSGECFDENETYIFHAGGKVEFDCT